MVITIVRLVEEKVGGQFFVLVACEVSLNDLFAGEAETAELSSRS